MYSLITHQSNGDVPMHVGKNVRTGMICKHVALEMTSKAQKFLLSVSTLTGSDEIRTKLIANA